MPKRRRRLFRDNGSSTDSQPLRVTVRSDPSEWLEGLREVIAETRAAPERMEAELARWEAANN